MRIGKNNPGGLLPAAFLALFMASSALAEPTASRIDFGVMTDPFLGQREILGWGDRGILRLSHGGATDDARYRIMISAEPDGEGLRLDGSFLERRFGSWTLGVGAIERHWSPSRHTSLILSGNARPFPSVYLSKTEPSAFASPLLAWIGPWDGEIFVGATSPDDHSHTGIVGARLTIRPFEGFEAELVRTAQWDRTSSSSALDGFFDALVGDTNEGDSASINRMAGLGLSYRLPEAVLPARVYLQAIGEDEAGGLPSCFMTLAGAEFEGTVAGAPTRVTLEGIDTRIGRSTNGFCGAGTAYANSKHPYVNFGTVMGAAIDGDGRAIEMRVSHRLAGGDWNWGIGHYVINDADLPDHRLSSERVSGVMAHIGLTRRFEAMTLEALVAYQGFELDRVGFGRGARIGVNLTRSF